LQRKGSRTYGNSSARPNWAVRAVLVLIALAFVSHFASAGGETRPLRIMFTSDTRGMLRRCGCTEGQMGGLSARATFIHEHDIPGKTLVLDAGDTFFGEPVADPERREFYRLKMDTIVEAMEACGTDASTVGEYDLAEGLDLLEETCAKADFPFLSANVKRDTLACWNRSPFEGSAVLDAGGIRVGVVGVADSVFPYTDFPESMSDVEVLDTFKAASYELRRIRKESDIIVVLAHVNFITPEQLADALEGGADVIIQGHSQEQLEEPIKHGGTLIVKGYDKAKHIGVLDLEVGKDGEVVTYGFREYPLGEDIPLDEEVEKLLDAYRAVLKERKFDFAVRDPEDEGSYTGSEACARCHEDEYAAWLATPHSWALDELTKTADEYDPECLVCHTTGYRYVSGYRSADPVDSLKNVGCEMCHGRGSGHIVRHGGSTEAGQEVGDAIRLEVPEEVCRGCHDEENSPTFVYETYLGIGGDHSAAGKR